jgi:hypothetical protein
MQSYRASALCGAAVAAVALVWSGPGGAAERGDFGQYLSGNNIGAAIAAPAPPGLYFVLDTFYGPHGEGFGQNNAPPLQNQKVSAFLYAPTLFWSTGYTLLGGKLSMAVVQPFLNVASFTDPAASAGPPISGATWLDSIENTQITPLILDWSLGRGWFGGVGMTFVVPDGSRYNGTANSDYFSFQPRAFLAYLDKDWHLTANFRYNINTASAGHTGFYQSEAAGLAAGVSGPFAAAFAPTVASIGHGYRSGDMAFLDAAALYQYKKWEFGPVASLKYQTTADTAGGGFTCAQLPTAVLGGAIPVPGCGKSQSVAVGGLIGVDLGAAHFQMWATDSVHTQDDFGGWGVYSRLIFKITDDAPAARPLITK